MSNIGIDDCIVLMECIYGLVKAVRHYYEKNVDVLKNLEFIGDNVNLYLYVKKSMKCALCVVLNIDNYLMIGDKVAIDHTNAALKSNWLVLNIMEGLQDYLSYKIAFSEDKKGLS